MAIPSKTKRPPAMAVHTNLDPDDVSDLLLETYLKWVSFALGTSSIGGKKLKHPSGRYAASIVAKKDSNDRIVGIMIDQSSEGAKQAAIIEHGHKQVKMKDHMLRGKASRAVPIAKTPEGPLSGLGSFSGGNAFTSYRRIQVNKRLARIWAVNYNYAHFSTSNVRTMSRAPGSAKWLIPRFPAMRPAKILRDQLPPGVREKVGIP